MKEVNFDRLWVWEEEEEAEEAEENESELEYVEIGCQMQKEFNATKKA